MQHDLKVSIWLERTLESLFDQCYFLRITSLSATVRLERSQPLIGEPHARVSYGLVKDGGGQSYHAMLAQDQFHVMVSSANACQIF